MEAVFRVRLLVLSTLPAPEVHGVGGADDGAAGGGGIGVHRPPRVVEGIVGVNIVAAFGPVHAQIPVHRLPVFPVGYQNLRAGPFPPGVIVGDLPVGGNPAVPPR